MLQQVLTIAATILHLTNDTNQLWVQAMHTKVYGCTLTSLNDFLVNLLLHLRHDLLNTGRMNTSISYQLMQGQTADFTSNGVESTDNNSLWGIIYYNLNTCSSLQGTNVTTFTTNDTALYLVVLDMENSYTVLNSRFCCHTLDGLYDNSLSLLVGSHLGIIHNLVDIGSSTCLGLILKRFYQTFTSLIHTETRDLLQLGSLLLQQTPHTLLHLFFFLLKYSLLGLQTCTQRIRFLLTTCQLILSLVKAEFSLLGSVLCLLNLLVTLANLLFQLSFLADELLLNFQ